MQLKKNSITDVTELAPQSRSQKFEQKVRMKRRKKSSQECITFVDAATDKKFGPQSFPSVNSVTSAVKKIFKKWRFLRR
jgi:hypothetical protein